MDVIVKGTPSIEVGFTTNVIEKFNKIDIDPILSTTSENPVMNKVITEELGKKATTIALSTLEAKVDTNKESTDNALLGLSTKVNNNEAEIQSLEKIKANTTGYYPSLHVGTADDLAGRGESVPAEFGFRASGGKSIKDGRAYIKRIKGNSVVWNQLALPFNELTNTPFYSFSIANGVLTITVLREHAANSAAIHMKNSTISGHSYLFTIDGSNSQNIDMQYRCGSAFNKFSVPIANAASKADLYIYPFGAMSTTIPAGATATIKSWRIHDLTQMFQAGNEPTTIEEFNARVATLGVDLNAHSEGEVIHCNTESIKSVGDNAWDEEWELGILNSTGVPSPNDTRIRPKNFTRVIPNETYYFHGIYGYGIYFYDADKNYITTLYVNNNKLQIPSNAIYLKFNFPTNYGTIYKGDYMISLVHSGWKQDTDAGYQPYWQDTLPLPIIRKYFPQGMKSAGTAHDEIRYNKATQKWEYSKGKIKSVDLGSLNWGYQPISESYPLGYFSTTINGYKIGGEGLCSKFARSEANWNMEGWRSSSSSPLIYVKTAAYTDATTFKAAMAGVILYYESNDWEWVELDSEDQNFRDYYNVADFGTEQSQSSVPSAAFSADIIYQFNAVDMIREHELEIAELQSIIATMQAQLASLTNKE